jgi:hypothetical protein
MKLEFPDEIKDAKEMYDAAHQVAVGILAWIKKTEGAKGLKQMGFLAVPHELTMDLLEKIVRRIPREFVKVEEARGHARLFASGTYEIVKAIPSALVVEALKEAKILKA